MCTNTRKILWISSNMRLTDDFIQLQSKLKSMVKDVKGVSKVVGLIHCDKDGSHHAISRPGLEVIKLF